MDNISGQITDNVHKTYEEYTSTFVISIITVTVVLVAVAWNDVVSSAFDKYFPIKRGKKNIRAKFIYALLVTFTVITLQLYVFPNITSKSINPTRLS